MKITNVDRLMLLSRQSKQNLLYKGVPPLLIHLQILTPLVINPNLWKLNILGLVSGDNLLIMLLMLMYVVEQSNTLPGGRYPLERQKSWTKTYVILRAADCNSWA